MMQCGLSHACAEDSANNTSTLNLFHSCQHTIRMMDSEPNKANADDVNGADYCIGYFHGIEDIIEVYGSTGVCIKDASLGTVIRVYMAYMEKHPKLLDDLEVAGVLEALHDSYSCPANH
jgi:hypothetical protein